jgi:hypothetical protein
MTFRALYTDLSTNDIKLSSMFQVLRLVLVYWDQGGECWVDLNVWGRFKDRVPSRLPETP